MFREYEIRKNGVIVLETGTYEGDTDFGYFFGKGKYDFDSGAVYSGGFENNEMLGLGTLNIPSEEHMKVNLLVLKKVG